MKRDEIERIFKLGLYIGMDYGWRNCENQDIIPEIKNNKLNFENEQVISIIDNNFDEICEYNEIELDENKIWEYKRKI